MSQAFEYGQASLNLAGTVSHYLPQSALQRIDEARCFDVVDVGEAGDDVRPCRTQ